jgi:hypothetical protein
MLAFSELPLQWPAYNNSVIRPCGFEWDFILFLIVGVDVRQLAVLGSQEVEHVEVDFL